MELLAVVSMRGYAADSCLLESCNHRQSIGHYRVGMMVEAEDDTACLRALHAQAANSVWVLGSRVFAAVVAVCGHCWSCQCRVYVLA